jgi:glycosyltransferase involved in cell wall biosynthesis
VSDGGEPPLVSVVIPCHNQARYLAEAIESALAQTHPRCEVIVVDDGSADESRVVAERYGARVRLLSIPHAGVERAVNLAVREAAGEYVARLDADDVFEPAYVETLLAALASEPDAAFAYCPARQFGARSGLTRSFPFSAYILARRGNYMSASALTARTDFLALGGYDEGGEHAYEDWDLWLKLVEAGRRGTFVRAPLLRWRRHAEGSRTPAGSTLDRSRAALLGRHADLLAAVSDRRGRVAYALDFLLAAADLLIGFSRSRRLVRALERRSWSRFLRWHAPRLQGRTS